MMSRHVEKHTQEEEQKEKQRGLCKDEDVYFICIYAHTYICIYIYFVMATFCVAKPFCIPSFASSPVKKLQHTKRRVFTACTTPFYPLLFIFNSIPLLSLLGK